MDSDGILRPLAVFMLAGLLAGCAAAPAPVVMDSNFQRRVVTQCDDDQFCFRHAYEVVWDQYCIRQAEDGGAVACGKADKGVLVRAEFPISYRSLEQVVETGADGYLVALPAAGAVRNRR